MSPRLLLQTVLLGAVLLTPILPPAALATRQVASICESAAMVASRESGVPLDVLRAISLTETGRKRAGEFQPWPWTVNMEGTGKWFDDLQSAQAYIDRHFDRGARSFDVGCFQINYRWHGQAFSSIEEMFDPISNARYAARFLNDLHLEFGNWSAAAGAYHSRTPRYARKYTARFDRIRSNLSEVDHFPARVPTERVAVLDVIETVEKQRRVNAFPLLQPGRPSNTSSLVPIDTQVGDSLIDFAAARPLVADR